MKTPKRITYTYIHTQNCNKYSNEQFLLDVIDIHRRILGKEKVKRKQLNIHKSREKL